jgi:hypothetical protein
MSGRNPNVFYEVGYAHAKNKLCILLTKNASDIPFDLKHHRHIVYSSVKDLKIKLAQDLEHAKQALAEREQPITVELERISGYLERTKYSAEAEVTIRLGMNNKTKNTSPEIDTIYFYTGDGWSFTQDKQECPASNSDVKDFKKRHFLKSPAQRINKNGWIPINLVGKKTVATAWKGEELKDEYQLTGVAIVRVRTASGDFDSKVDLKVIANEIPF